MIQKPRGTMDILPEDVAVWQYIEKKAREVEIGRASCRERV